MLTSTLKKTDENILKDKVKSNDRIAGATDYDILKSKSHNNHSLSFAKVKQNELIIFTTQLSVMLDSGVVLSDALDAFAEQSPDGNFRDIVIEISDSVKSGENFSKSLTNFPRIFSSMFISMVRASEASGKMSEMLSVLSGYLAFEAETKKRIKGALTYPFHNGINGSCRYRYINVFRVAEVYKNL